MWYEQARWKSRLRAEVDIMHERFPGMELQQIDDGSLAWVGELEPVEGFRCVVVVSYPVSFPYVEPKMDVIDPPLVDGAPHLFSDGGICVHKNEWNPDRGTAASMIPLLAGWWVAYVHWLQTGEKY